MAQLMQNHAGRIEPEPDEQSALAEQPIADLIHAPTQTPARETQERKEDKDGSDKKPGAVCGQLFIEIRVHALPLALFRTKPVQ